MHNSLKDRVLEATDIVEVVSQRVSLKRRGREYVGLCPFHDDHKPSLYVNPQKQIFKCFACGAGGDAIRFVQLSARVDFREALTILARQAGMDPKLGAPDPAVSRKRDQLRRVLEWAAKWFERNLWQPVGREALEYARRRGMSDETLRAFSIGYAPQGYEALIAAARQARVEPQLLIDAGLAGSSERGRVYDRFRHRLIFPIRDASGRVVGFGGRTLGDDPAKYLNTPETALFHKARLLYGLDRARDAIRQKREAVVVEGYTDVVLLHQAGVCNAVATLGTALSDEHVRLLAPLAERVTMCFDADAAGARAAERAVEVALSDRIEVKVALLPTGQDPAELVIGAGPQVFEQRLLEAIDALEFRWQQTLRQAAGGGPAAQRQAAEGFVRLVAQAAARRRIDPVAEGLLVGRVAELVGLPPTSVYSLLERIKRSARTDVAETTPDTSRDTSAYVASLEGLPGGLISATEELFGLVLRAGSCDARTRDVLMQTAVQCPCWQALLRRIEAQGAPFELATLIAGCDDPAELELIQRALKRVPDEPPVGLEDELRQRVLSELEVVRVGQLRAELLRRTEPDGADEAFRALLESARRAAGVLGPEHRWLSRSSPERQKHERDTNAAGQAPTRS